MTEVVGVRFERAGKIYYFASGDLQLGFGDHVIVDSSRGLDFGTVTTPVQELDEGKLGQPLRTVVRLATEADERSYENVKKLEPAALAYCQQQIEKFGLPMKLIRVSYTFDGSKIVFYFSSENRVDFRELVKVLAGHFHTRIELRQVGVRDEARIVGGYSTCGRELCCASFLENFHPVSIKMAKKQNLALNPAKISGVCGRLMCCLYYEYDENGSAIDDDLEPGECPAKKSRELAETAEELTAGETALDGDYEDGGQAEMSQPEKGRGDKARIEKDHIEKDHIEKDLIEKNHAENHRAENPRAEKSRAEKNRSEKNGGGNARRERPANPRNRSNHNNQNSDTDENKSRRGARRGRRPEPKKAACDNNCRECQQQCSRRRPAVDSEG